MSKLLVTGGTVFVSRYVAEYFARRGNEVYVLNRGSRPQAQGVRLIQADRHELGGVLKDYDFDAVLDITAYTAGDIEDLVAAMGSFRDYIFISSSAVYPETLPQPFHEEQICGPNIHWGDYGMGKLAAEERLRALVPQAYILRPPYLYGPMQNLYREPFVFDCVQQGRKFYLPAGDLKLQFCHVEDLCRFIGVLLEKHPQERVYNVGDPEAVSAADWVALCYEAVGEKPELVRLEGHPEYRYFCFRPYDYCLDVSRQNALMAERKPLLEGLRESYRWYQTHREEVRRKAYLDFLDELV